MTAALVATTLYYGPDDHIIRYRGPVNPQPKPHNKNTITAKESKILLTGLSNKPCSEYRYSRSWCKNWNDGRLYNSVWTSTTVDRTDGWSGSGNTTSLSTDSGSEGLLLEVEEEVDAVGCADPDDLTLPLLPDFGFFLGTSSSAVTGSQYKTLSFRTASLSKTCWWEYKTNGRGPESGKTKYQVKYSERPNDTLPTTLLWYEWLFTAVSMTDGSLASNDKATVYSCYKAF